MDSNDLGAVVGIGGDAKDLEKALKGALAQLDKFYQWQQDRMSTEQAQEKANADKFAQLQQNKIDKLRQYMSSEQQMEEIDKERQSSLLKSIEFRKNYNKYIQDTIDANNKEAESIANSAYKAQEAFKTVESSNENFLRSWKITVISINQTFNIIRRMALYAKEGFDELLKASSFQEQLNGLNAWGKQFNTTAPEILVNTNKITNGLISMQETARLSGASLRAGMSPEQFNQLIHNAEQLSHVWGVTVPEAYDKLFNAISGGRAVSLKQMGFIVDFANDIELVEGKEAQLMSTMDKRAQFQERLNVVDKEANRQILELGDTTDSLHTEMVQLTTSLNNVKTEALLTVGTFADLATKSGDSEGAIHKLATRIFDAVPIFGAIRQELGYIREGIQWLGDSSHYGGFLEFLDKIRHGFSGANKEEEIPTGVSGYMDMIKEQAKDIVPAHNLLIEEERKWASKVDEIDADKYDKQVERLKKEIADDNARMDKLHISAEERKKIIAEQNRALADLQAQADQQRADAENKAEEKRLREQAVIHDHELVMIKRRQDEIARFDREDQQLHDDELRMRERRISEQNRLEKELFEDEVHGIEEATKMENAWIEQQIKGYKDLRKEKEDALQLGILSGAVGRLGASQEGLGILEREKQSIEELLGLISKDSEKYEQVHALLVEINFEIDKWKIKQQELTGTFSEGFAKEIKKWLDSVSTQFENGVAVAKATADGMSNAFQSGFFDAMQGKFKGFASYFQSFIASIEQAISKMLADKLVSQILGGFSNLFNAGGGGSSASSGLGDFGSVVSGLGSGGATTAYASRDFATPTSFASRNSAPQINLTIHNVADANDIVASQEDVINSMFVRDYGRRGGTRQILKLRGVPT